MLLARVGARTDSTTHAATTRGVANSRARVLAYVQLVSSLVSAQRIEAGHDHVMRTIIEIPSDSSIHFLRRKTRPFFTGRPEGISLKL